MASDIDLLLGANGLWALEVADLALIRYVWVDASLRRRVVRAYHCDEKIKTVSRNGIICAPCTTAISVHYPIILDGATLAQYGRCYNLHPGFLPFGRGMYPMVWAIAKGEPAGATLHVMTEKLDVGPIVDQEQVAVLDTDTAATLGQRVYAAERDIFKRFWDRIVHRGAEAIPDFVTTVGAGSYHSRADFERLRELREVDVERMSADDLLRHARAFTSPPHAGAVVVIADKSFELTLTPL